MPADTFATENFSALVAAAQDVPTSTEIVDGEEVVRYGQTPEAEAAFASLFTTFLPAIERAAHGSKTLDYDDAFGAAVEEFVTAVRDYDVASALPFHAKLSTRLRYAVLRADRANDVIHIKDNFAAVYWRLIHRHNGDARAAYADTKTAAVEMAPATFLAIHNVISGIDSLDGVLAAQDDDNAPCHALAAAVESHEDRIVDRAEAEWLLSLVDDTQRAICRLAYGFDAIPEEIREEAAVEVARSREEGVALVKDGTLARHLGLSRPKVQRERTKALATMRAALEGVPA